MPITLRDDEAEQIQYALDGLRSLCGDPNSAGWNQAPDPVDVRAWVRDIRYAFENAQDRASARNASGRRRDTQKSKVYRAEATRPSKAVVGMADQRAFVTALLNEEWFVRRFPGLTVGQFDFVPESSSVWAGRLQYRPLAKHPYTLLLRTKSDNVTILHEVAHACHRALYGIGTGPEHASHGPEFCGIFVHLVVNFVSEEEGRALLAALRLAGCEVVGLATQAARLQRAGTAAVRA
jgi:hypothetical protein